MTTPTGILFYEPRAKPLSTSGNIQPGSYYQFYLTGTTTAANVYTDGLLTVIASQTPATGQTTAASDGRLVPLYMNPATIYRVQLYSSTGVLLEDTDPYVPSQTQTQTQVGQTLWPQTTAELANSVTPTNYFYAPGDIRRYGASSSNTDNGPAVNNALKCNTVVFDGETSGPTIYPVQSTIAFRAAGQTLRGAGFGDTNNTGALAPRTTFKWTGTAGAAVITVSDAVRNYSETILQNICIDANSLAAQAVQGYNDAFTTGCWRNIYKNVAAINATSVGMYFGNNASGFANDPFLENCYVWNCATGIWVIGAVPQLHHCTIGICTIGLKMPGNGAEVKIYGGVFHTNGTDIDAGATGVTQNIACFGTWFENSTTGIYVTHNSHSAQFIGCHLHTSNVTGMMNMNGQAGHLTVKSWIPSPTGSFVILNNNSSYDYDLLGTGIVGSQGYKEYVASGLVRINNSDFMCAPAADAANATGDATTYSLNTGTFNFDRNTDSNVSATGVFTAPADGFYEFEVAITLSGLTSSHTVANLWVTLSGGTGTVLLASVNPWAMSAGSSSVLLFGRVRATMFKGNTAWPSVQVSGGTKVVTVFGGGGGTSWRTRFSGKLA